MYSEGHTLDFLLSAKRDAQAAKRCLRKTVNVSHTTAPWVINVDKNAAYPKAFAELKEEGLVADTASRCGKTSISTMSLSGITVSSSD